MTTFITGGASQIGVGLAHLLRQAERSVLFGSRAGRGTDHAEVLLLPGPEDRDIWRYFATASMPDEREALAVLEALEANGTMSVPQLETAVSMKRTALELLLSDEGADYGDRDGLFDACKALAERMEHKNGWLLYPLGIALSGKARTPGGGTDLAAMLGRDETLARLRAALAAL